MSNNALKQMQIDAMTEMIQERNALVAQVNAATGNKESLADSFRESDEFADLRNQIAELEDRLDALVDEKVKAALANASEVGEDVTEKIKELDAALTPGLTYFKKIYGDEAFDELPKRDRLKGTRSGGGGGGGKRIRGFNWIVTINGESSEYENAASTAKALAIETKQLQEALFAKAGVEQVKDLPNEVILTMSYEDVAEDGTKTPVTATIKAYRTEPVEAETEANEPATEPEPDAVEAADDADSEDVTEF